VKRQITAFRRGLRARRGGGLVRGFSLLGAALVLAWLAATLGHVAWNGGLWPGLGVLLPEAVTSVMASPAGALALFVTGALTLVVVLYLLGTLTRLATRRVAGD